MNPNDKQDEILRLLYSMDPLVKEIPAIGKRVGRIEVLVGQHDRDLINLSEKQSQGSRTLSFSWQLAISVIAVVLSFIVAVKAK